nr:hypothetical protein [Corynebacterium meitnerae]
MREAWEGQPDLPLATLFGILANQGAGWGTSDEELEELLRSEAEDHPAELPRTDERLAAVDILVETTSPDHCVTLTVAGDAVVRSGTERDRQPSVWRYSSIRPTGPGRMLVVADADGVEHRLGVVTLISRVGAAETLEGLERQEVGNSVWLIALADGARALVTQRIHLWRVDRRTVQKSTLAWDRIECAQPGEEFRFAPAGGGEPVALGEVTQILLLED